MFYVLESPEENLDVLVKLIDAGADVNQASVDGQTPLLKAAKKGYSQSVEHLIKQKADIHAKAQ